MSSPGGPRNPGRERGRDVLKTEPFTSERGGAWRLLRDCRERKREREGEGERERGKRERERGRGEREGKEREGRKRERERERERETMNNSLICSDSVVPVVSFFSEVPQERLLTH